MSKRTLLLVGALVASLVLATTGTLAYLTDTDSAVNVMTVGNVKIEQLELQRPAVRTLSTELKQGDLVDYVNGQHLYPVYPVGGADTAYDAYSSITWGPYVSEAGAQDNLWDETQLTGAMDKFVFVKNTGSSDAYVRTLIAVEMPQSLRNKIYLMRHETSNGQTDIQWNSIDNVTIHGENYMVWVATYEKALPAGKISVPSLLQVALHHTADNADMTALGENFNIYALTQAMQVQNFENTDPETALNVAFTNGNSLTPAQLTEWFEAIAVPEIFSWEGVNYVTEGSTATVQSNGGTTIYRGILSDGKTSASSVVIGEGITRLNNRALCKTSALTSVSLPQSLTYIDESVFQQSGFVEIEIPENVTYIGKQAMGSCGSLEKIVIRAKNVTIGNYVARACANLKEVYFYSDSVTFESGSMYFTNKESADASGITFYVKDQAMADNLYSAFSTSHSYGLLIKSLDGATTFYNTLK